MNITSWTLLLALAFLGTAALADFADLTDDLADDDALMNRRLVRDTPEWFERIKDSFSEPGTELKKCGRRRVAPNNGRRCGRKRKTCFFGTQQCSGVGAHPVTKCSCIGEINEKGEWACDDEVCQENDEDTIVQAASGMFRSSPARALDVTMNLLTPAVLQGYDNIEDLSDDLNQAVRFYVNSVIEQQALHNNRFSPLPFVIEPDDQVVFAVTSESKTTASPSAEGATDFETNNQEEGVDEADKVKSDGMYTYAAYGDVVVVWNVITGDLVANYTLPQLFYSDAASGPSVPTTSLLTESRPLFHHRPKPVIQAMSLEAQRLVLYVQGYGSEVREQNKITSVFSNAYETRIMVLDTSTLPLSLTFVTQEDVQGSYRDARAIGSDIHLVTSASINYYALTGPLYRFNSVFADMDSTEYKKAAAKIAEPLIDDFVATLKADVLLNGIAPSIPKISIWQSDLGNNTNIVEQIYKEGAIQAYVQLTSFAVKGLDGALSLSVAGAFTPSSWGHTYAVDGNLVFAAQGWNWSPFLRGSSQTTYLLGFSLNGASAAPAYLGSVPGYILNQYSLSAYEGHLRVAATVDTVWPIWEPIEDRNGDIISPLPLRRLQNSVHILKIPSEDESVLHEVANIPNLGKKGERFTAVRFFGNICYAVTFLRTDPFYVLDLNPADAKVLGELEISGFSSYLHSINDDDSLLVAVGEETDENGRVLGVQVTLFDAKNASNPVLLHRSVVEQEKDVWSSSSVQWDFKAFRWLSLGNEVGILIMPLRVVASDRENLSGNFDGFFAYDVSRSGISQRLKISHVSSKNFYGCYYRAYLPERSLVFNGNVTTMKGHSVVSTDLDSGEQRWTLDMPAPDDEGDCGFWMF